MTGLLKFLEENCYIKPQYAYEEAFERLFSSRKEERRTLMEEVARLDATLLITAALHSYNNRGNAERLDLLVTVLDKMGRACLTAIKRLAGHGCEAEETLAAFIIHADFIHEEERADLLQRFARSPRSETWEKLLEALPCLEIETQIPVLAGLARSKELSLMDTACGDNLDKLANYVGLHRNRRKVRTQFKFVRSDFRVGFSLKNDPIFQIKIMPFPTLQIILEFGRREKDEEFRMRVRQAMALSLGRV